jgi:hypothetical protein
LLILVPFNKIVNAKNAMVFCIGKIVLVGIWVFAHSCSAWWGIALGEHTIFTDIMVK